MKEYLGWGRTVNHTVDHGGLLAAPTREHSLAPSLRLAPVGLMEPARPLKNLMARATAFPPGTLAQTELLDALGIVALATDPSGVITHWTTAASQLYGRPAAEMIGRPVSTVLLAPEDEAIAPAVAARLLATGEWQGELEIRTAGGSPLLLTARCTVLRDRRGHPVAVVACFSDPRSRLSVARTADVAESEQTGAPAIVGVNSWEWDPRSDRLVTADPCMLVRPVGSRELMMRDALAAMPTHDRQRVRDALSELIADPPGERRIEFRVTAPDGSVHWLRAHLRAVCDAQRDVCVVRGTTRNITASLLAAGALAEAGEFWRAALDSLSARVAVLNQDGVIIAVNEHWREFAISEGVTVDHVGVNYLEMCDQADEPWAQDTGLAVREILAGDRESYEREYPGHGRAQLRWFLFRAARYWRAGPAGVVVAHQEITKCRLATGRPREGVYAVDLEGRVTYMDRVAEQLLGWSFRQLRGRVMHSLTREQGEGGGQRPSLEPAVLQACRENRVIRVDGDVFIRRDGSELPVAYTVTPLRTGASLEGCAVEFEDITQRRAVSARLEGELRALTWMQRLQDALTEQNFVLYAQPIIDLSMGGTVQRELLLRMQFAAHGSGGPELVLPAAFLPVAERYGFIADIDRWVIDRAAELAATGASVEINVSARSISDSGLAAHIRSALARSGADPSRLVFEITETALISDTRAARGFVAQLHELGCELALDDFGTGYGSFTYLKQMPIDYLKIDIEFVRDLPHDPASRKVVQAIVNVAQGFAMSTIAEGVEDARTLELLREIGVDRAQGFHLGRPTPLKTTELS